MGRKYTSFGVKYQKILVGWHHLNYEDVFVETLIYIRYVVLTIVNFTSMLTIELFYLTQLCSFLGCFFEYLPLFLPWQVCDTSLTRIKDFRTFWPCYFVDPSVKGTDNFWKIRGLIDVFNESRRHIYSGVKKWHMRWWVPYDFIPPPKGDLPHYSFIFRKPEPLGIDTKNVACSMLGTMLYLYIQKGKEATKM